MSHFKSFPRPKHTTHPHAANVLRDVQTEDSCLYTYWTILTGTIFSKHNIEKKKKMKITTETKCWEICESLNAVVRWQNNGPPRTRHNGQHPSTCRCHSIQWGNCKGGSNGQQSLPTHPWAAIERKPCDIMCCLIVRHCNSLMKETVKINTVISDTNFMA